MTQNNMEHIDEAAFHMNQQLLNLNLEKNKLVSVSKRLLDSLSNLKYLNLKENRLVELEDYSFNALGRLEHLDLTRNKIRVLTDKTFEGLVSLKVCLLKSLKLKHKRLNLASFGLIGTPALIQSAQIN